MQKTKGKIWNATNRVVRIRGNAIPVAKRWLKEMNLESGKCVLVSFDALNERIIISKKVEGLDEPKKRVGFGKMEEISL